MKTEKFNLKKELAKANAPLIQRNRECKKIIRRALRDIRDIIKNAQQLGHVIVRHNRGVEELPDGTLRHNRNNTFQLDIIYLAKDPQRANETTTTNEQRPKI